jgi:hypothetical protein
VVSRTVEAGFRGTQDLTIGNLSWKVGALLGGTERRHDFPGRPAQDLFQSASFAGIS